MANQSPSDIRREVLERAEGILSDLETGWDDVPRLDSFTVVALPGQDDTFSDSADEFFERFYPYAAGAAVTDDDGRLPCVYSPVREEWETPGGAGEAGETPAETARRETREETGVECELTGVLHARLMEFDFGPDELLPVPVVEFTGRPGGGEGLTEAEIEDHGGICDLDRFGPDDLPTHVREYEQKHAHLRWLG